MAAIELNGVTKRFEDDEGLFDSLLPSSEPDTVTAVDDLSFSVAEGEVFGFLGPNGAGKSTTINMLLDFARPTSGSVRVLGHDAQAESVAVRRRTGVLPEGYEVYDRLTGREHVEFAIESKEADDDPDELLSRVGLDADEAARRAGGYSKGMSQRLALAMALAGSPDLLVLDEPSSGLDPAGAREMRDIVRAEADRGATVFFSSHVLGQVEAVCDRVGIMREGRLIAEDTIEGLRDRVDAEAILRIDVDGDADLDAVRALDGVSSVETDGDRLVVGCTDDAKTRVIEAVEAGGATVADFETDSASLEDIFLAYTEGDDSADEPEVAA
ncbi:ABC transporter ATP-binding protein [Haloferax sulfurifontis]|uniref:ABC transporter ATP-binding protein n=1 Tax=Haloferax sulfurifontis ATCC BAA-897 TaxID=662480 RepID=M0IBY4_9EURY|nr:ABC transporter ATP-binding protein [Haloferax sulfurifontis]ELZ94315.1 ABC transporter ATP-binding protein [Haloferax sulfurifontis ATCC BAA-897]